MKLIVTMPNTFGRKGDEVVVGSLEDIYKLTGDGGVVKIERKVPSSFGEALRQLEDGSLQDIHLVSSDGEVIDVLHNYEGNR